MNPILFAFSAIWENEKILFRLIMTSSDWLSLPKETLCVVQSHWVRLHYTATLDSKSYISWDGTHIHWFGLSLFRGRRHNKEQIRFIVHGSGLMVSKVFSSRVDSVMYETDLLCLCTQYSRLPTILNSPAFDLLKFQHKPPKPLRIYLEDINGTSVVPVFHIFCYVPCCNKIL